MYAQDFNDTLIDIYINDEDEMSMHAIARNMLGGEKNENISEHSEQNGKITIHFVDGSKLSVTPTEDVWIYVS